MYYIYIYIKPHTIPNQFSYKAMNLKFDHRTADKWFIYDTKCHNESHSLNLQHPCILFLDP